MGIRIGSASSLRNPNPRTFNTRYILTCNGQRSLSEYLCRLNHVLNEQYDFRTRI